MKVSKDQIFKNSKHGRDVDYIMICIVFTLFSVKAVVEKCDVWGVTTTNILLHRPYNFAETPVTT
jgi:hypothetical protein